MYLQKFLKTDINIYKKGRGVLMKKILGFIFILLFAFTFIDGAGVLAKEKFEYPITTSSEEWKEFTTRDQMIAATRIPEEILKDMTTEELVVALFEYPLLVNLVLYNDDEIALREFEIICDAYRELITRNDSAYVLQEYINNLEDEEVIQKIASEVLLNSKIIFTQSIVAEQKIIAGSKSTLLNIGYVQTPNSTDVLVFNISSMTQAEVTAYNNSATSAYPLAILVDDSSSDYNCHSFAWYSSSVYNDWWMNQDYTSSGLPGYPGVLEYMTDGSYSRVYSAYDASRVFFQGSDHSMRIHNAYSNSIYNADLISKWGPGPVMIHKVNYGPYSMTGYTMWN
jgi:hypothetical protein